MDIKEILQPIKADIADVNQLIRQRLDSDVVLIKTLGEYIINAGGKRLRPALVLMSARACGNKDSRHDLLAALIEFIHTATLLHDDVVDESTQRRGQTTANEVWGNDASVLTGDFLYTRAFQMMVEVGHPSVMKVLAYTTNRIAEGEVMQLMNSHDPDLSEADYLEVIDRKTASLFAAGCRLAAEVSGCSEEVVQAMDTYGRQLGVAFQIIDDALDYGHGGDEADKNIGDDLAEGKTTLPVIYALQHLSDEESLPIRQAITDGDASQLDTIIKAIEKTQAMEYTCKRAEQAAEQAIRSLDALPPSPEREALANLAHFAVQRRH